MISLLCTEGLPTSRGLLLLCVQVEALVPHDAAEVDKPAHRKRLRQEAFDGECCSMLPGRLQGRKRQLVSGSMIASDCLLVSRLCADVRVSCACRLPNLHQEDLRPDAQVRVTGRQHQPAAQHSVLFSCCLNQLLLYSGGMLGCAGSCMTSSRASFRGKHGYCQPG